MSRRNRPTQTQSASSPQAGQAQTLDISASATEVDSRATSKTRRRIHLGGLLDLESGWLITTVFFVVIAVEALTSAGTIPTITNGLIVLAMCYAWNLVGGSLGELSFAHMIFWAIGGYGIISVTNHGDPILLWLIVIVIGGAIAGAGVAALISAAGLSGMLPVAIFTLVIGVIAYTIAQGSHALGGDLGLVANTLPSYSVQVMFVILLVIAAITAVVNLVVTNNRLGRELLAIRDDKVAAKVAGINVGQRRYIVYMLSAALFALGGAYQSYYAGSATPDVTLGITPLIVVTLAVFVGGPGTRMGPLIGTIIIYGLQAATQQVSTSANVALYAQLIAYGAALVLLRLVFPKLKGVDLATAAIRGVRSMRRKGLAPDQEPPVFAAPANQLADRVLATGDARGTNGLGANGSRDGLELTHVQKSFGHVNVLRGATFSIRPGEVVGIVGPNGAGKSTLCNLISGVEPPSGGTIRLNGVDVTGVPIHRRSSHGVGRSFQTPRLFASLSLADNLTLARMHMGETQAEEVLQLMGIPDAGHRGGDDSQFFARRLTEVAKAAMQGSAVLMLDEPLAGLTSEEHEIVLAMARHAADAGACVGIVEHLIPVLAPAVDRIVVLHGGHIIADGLPAAVLQQEDVVDAYLGTAHTMEEAQ